MRLPVHFEDAGLPGYDGVVWFRKSVDLPESLAGKEATLSLGAVDDMDVTWVNGRRVGGYEKAGHHFTPRDYPVPAGVLQAGKNVIAVRVMDHGWGGGICGEKPQPEQMQLAIGGSAMSLAGPWRFKAGADLKSLLAAQGGSSAARPAPFAGKFALADGDVVVLTGGTDAVKAAEAGHLEALLTLSAADRRVFLRSMAWQADTVYRQQRPLNFASHRDELERIGATVVIAMFGQMEALDGAARLADFAAAYEALLDGYAGRTPRIVLVTPRPFEAVPGLPHAPDLTAHNADVAAYAQAIRDLGARRGYPVVDLAGFKAGPLTRDGIHLTPAGHWRVAFEIGAQLTGETPISQTAADENGAFADGRLEALRQAIARKEQLWHQHWRPTNWAFAYGDRQHVPSSHDHRPGMPRWFPAEIDSIIPLIDAQEERIAELKSQALER
ncbi:MAG: GDSL-type esterase/lipase family protein [Verrucomicrobiales bacterium]